MFAGILLCRNVYQAVNLISFFLAPQPWCQFESVYPSVFSSNRCGWILITLLVVYVQSPLPSPVLSCISLSYYSGIGFGLIYLPAITVVGHWFERHRAFVVGLAMCGGGLGSAVLAALIRPLARRVAWRGMLLLTGALLFQTLVCSGDRIGHLATVFLMHLLILLFFYLFLFIECSQSDRVHIYSSKCPLFFLVTLNGETLRH